ncbi:MAG: YCF48-related protein [Bacteroidia bacterium]
MKTAKILFLSFFILVFSFESESQTASWTPLTSGTTQHLSSVSAINKDTVYVCGDSGTILKTINGGITWTPQSSGVTDNLISMSFYDSNNGLIVYELGGFLVTTDGGTTWVQSGYPPFLRYIYFYNDSLGYAVGTSGTMYEINFGGGAWAPYAPDTSYQYNCVFLFSPQIYYVCGNGGLIRQTIDGGITWVTQTSGVSSSLNAIRFQSTTDGIAVGDTGVILKTTNSGGIWTPVTAGTTDFLTGLDFIDASQGFIVGGNVSSNTGSILETSNGGSTWTTSFPGSSRLTRVDMVNPNTGYAVGLDGTILKYTSNVGILENGNGSVLLNIFPNPAQNQITVEFSSFSTALLKITNVLGQIVYSETMENALGKQNKNIDISAFSNGIYFVRIKNDKESISKKFIKE